MADAPTPNVNRAGIRPKTFGSVAKNCGDPAADRAGWAGIVSVCRSNDSSAPQRSQNDASWGARNEQLGHRDAVSIATPGEIPGPHPGPTGNIVLTDTTNDVSTNLGSTPTTFFQVIRGTNATPFRRHTLCPIPVA
jgi:hypothetical protein